MSLAVLTYAQPTPPPAPAAPPAHMPMKFEWSGRDTYERGSRELDRRQYEKAIEYFTQTKGSKADGALYWKAYALSRLGRSSDALAALSELQKNHPQSPWLNDAKALTVEVQQAAGQPPRPESQEDEELKLLAINGMMHTDPESALPLLEKVLNSAKNPPRLKKRALYVLAQSRSVKAREIVTQYAKGGTNPDLQVTAVEYLGVINTPESRQSLADIYGATQDPSVKRAVLRGYMMTRDKDRLFAAAKSESNPDVRREAIQLLSHSGGHMELVQLYATETDKRTKGAIIDGLASSGKATTQLIEITRKETDFELKREAVQRLSTMKNKEATAFMAELLGKD